MRSSLRRFAAHLRKEARDQRGVLLGVGLALPVLTLLAYWGFGRRLVEAPVRDAAGIALPVALLLFALGVASDLAAGEVRRGTIALLRRTPGGLRTAFLAKGTLLLAGGLSVLLWESLVLVLAWTLFGRTATPGLLETFLQGAWSPWAVLVLVLLGWIFLASTWLAHGGMAALLAPILLGTVALPAFLWARAEPTLARWLGHYFDGTVGWIVAGAFLVPLVAGGASFVRGRRHVRSGFAAVWRGVAVLFLLVGAAYAYGGVRLHGMLDFRPGDADVVLDDPVLAPGGRVCWVNAVRSPGWDRAFFPARSWRIDLSSGRMEPGGPWGEKVFVPGVRWGRLWPGSSIAPQPRLVRSPAGDPSLTVWIDARSGETLKVLPDGVTTPVVRSWLDEAARIASPIRDALGRRCWLRTGDHALCREGEAPPPEGPDASPYESFRAIPGGWVFILNRCGTRGQWTLDATTGEKRVLPDPETYFATFLSPSRALTIGPGRKAALVEFPSGRIRDVRGASEAPVVCLAPLSVDRVLALAGSGDRRRLGVWNPVAGTWKDLPGLPRLGGPPDGAWVAGRTADGRALVQVFAMSTGVLAAWDPAHEEMTVLRRVSTSPFAVDEEGRVYGVEQGRRIVRYGPKSGERHVLFPR